LARLLCVAIVIPALCTTVGCGGGDGGGSATSGKTHRRSNESGETGRTASKRKPPGPTGGQVAKKKDARTGAPDKLSKEELAERRSLADLLESDDDPAPGQSDARSSSRRFIRPPMEIDDAKVAAAGIRRVRSKHLTLYTDLSESPEVDELPTVFDQALPQWCKYFQIDQAEHEDWHMTGFVVKDKDLFRRSGLLPDDLPPFLHGYQRDHEFWVYEQASAYYRRHLVLHEGTHGFMYLLVGGLGPPWYAEGMAELLGTHRWKDGQLTLRYFPRDKEEAPYWGRVKIIRDDFAANKGMTLTDVMKYGDRAHLEKQPYGWSWGAAVFFDSHPAYREEFRKLQKHVGIFGIDFSRRFHDQLADQWSEVNEQWQLFVVNMEYGYDVAREAVEYRPGQALPAGGTTVAIAADRGWQSTGVRVQAGTTYRVTAAGRYQVADQPKIWPSEPDGVTIRYWKGRPLGMLLGAIRDDALNPDQMTPLATPFPVGRSRTISPPESGTLYLRINDSPAELADNGGELTVEIRTQASPGK